MESSSKHVICNCNQCKGAKVDPRTRDAHMKKREFGTRSLIIGSSITEEGTSRSHIPDVDFVNDQMETDEIDINNSESSSEEEPNFLVKSPKKSKGKGKQSSHGGGRYPLVRVEQILYDSDEQYIDESDINDENDDESEDDNSEQHVEFDAPEYDYGNESSKMSIPDINVGFTWIIYWIFKFQERYRLADTATDSLIKFVRYILVSIDKNTYSEFPKTLYMARKSFGIGDQLIKFATCKKCCKLYAIKDLPTDRPFTCTFQDYPNHTMAKLRSSCNANITKQVPTNQGKLFRPSLIFPVTSIKHRLQQLYNKKGFEESCQKWAVRPGYDQELADIYDGRIWKTFQDPNQDLPFFRKEVSDSHLGIMLNLDWFQPFDNS